MSLNLYTILQKVLNESVSSDDVISAIKGHNYVEITYNDGQNSATDRRLIEPYAYGLSKGHNEVLRAFQVSGDTLRGKPHWKTFRLDRMLSWTPRKQTFSTPPPLRGYSVPNYNDHGDGSMASVIVQAQFDKDSLSIARNQRKDIANAPKISGQEQNMSGPVNAWQQRKKNVYTSQPNSKKYDMYRQNIERTKDDFNRMSDDIWAQAEKEREAQQNVQTVPQPSINPQGPINTNNIEKKNKDNE